MNQQNFNNLINEASKRLNTSPEAMKQFNRLGYHYDADVSDAKTYVFIKN